MENDLRLIEYNFSKGAEFESIIRQTFRLTEDIADIRRMSNA